MFVLEGLEVKTILKYAIHSYRQCPPKENKGKTSSTNHKVSAMCAHFRELAKNWSYRSHLVYHSKVKVILLIMELDIQISSKENLSCVYTFFFFLKISKAMKAVTTATEQIWFFFRLTILLIHSQLRKTYAFVVVQIFQYKKRQASTKCSSV